MRLARAQRLTGRATELGRAEARSAVRGRGVPGGSHVRPTRTTETGPRDDRPHTGATSLQTCLVFSAPRPRPSKSPGIHRKNLGPPPSDPGVRASAGLGGGESGIRTHGRVTPTHAFQACSFNRSDISPVARGAPPPLAGAAALARSLSSRRPRALLQLLAGPHPHSRALRRSHARYPRAGRGRFSSCSRGPTPTRGRCGARTLAILAPAAGASPVARGAPPPLAGAAALARSLSSRRPRALLQLLAGPHPHSRALRRSHARYPRAGRGRFSSCSRGPTPTRGRCGARTLAILAPAAGASPVARGVRPPSVSCRSRAASGLLACRSGAGYTEERSRRRRAAGRTATRNLCNLSL